MLLVTPLGFKGFFVISVVLPGDYEMNMINFTRDRLQQLHYCAICLLSTGNSGSLLTIL